MSRPPHRVHELYLREGDFRQTYNLIAITSANPGKAKGMTYYLGVENGDSAVFLLSIEELIVSGWSEVGNILIMDNTASYSHRWGHGDCCELALGLPAK